jgi:hypothetical protein
LLLKATIRSGKTDIKVCIGLKSTLETRIGKQILSRGQQKNNKDLHRCASFQVGGSLSSGQVEHDYFQWPAALFSISQATLLADRRSVASHSSVEASNEVFYARMNCTSSEI